MFQHPQCEEDSVKLTYIEDLLSRDHCWGSNTTSKSSCGPSRTNSLDWRNRWLKQESLCTANSLWKSSNSCITLGVKREWVSFNVCENCKVGDLLEVKATFSNHLPFGPPIYNFSANPHILLFFLHKYCYSLDAFWTLRTHTHTHIHTHVCVCVCTYHTLYTSRMWNKFNF